MKPGYIISLLNKYKQVRWKERLKISEPVKAIAQLAKSRQLFFSTAVVCSKICTSVGQ